MSRKGKQASLGDSLDLLMSRLDRKNNGAYRQVKVASAWEEVAGFRVAEHTAQAHLREGELLVYVDSALWATELSALAEPYRLRMNEILGREVVKTVRFTVSKRVDMRRAAEQQEAESTNPYQQEEIITRHELGPTEMDQLTESVSVIEDARLREAVLRATVADIEWKKSTRRPKSP